MTQSPVEGSLCYNKPSTDLLLEETPLILSTNEFANLFVAARLGLPPIFWRQSTKGYKNGDATARGAKWKGHFWRLGVSDGRGLSCHQN